MSKLPKTQPVHIISDSAGRRVGYYASGMLKLGWVYRLDAREKSALVHKWPFAISLDYVSAGVPFPVTEKEAEHLELFLKAYRIDWDDKDRDLVRRALHNARLRLAMSHAPTLPHALYIPGLKHRLFPFQDVAVKFLESLGWRGLVGDDMGLGKTMTGLAAALLSGSQRVVVVTRAVALPVWKRAITNWTSYQTRQCTGIKPSTQFYKDGRLKRKFPEQLFLQDDLSSCGMRPTILLLNYELLTPWEQYLLAFDPQFVLLDEVHAIKESKVRRNQAAYALMDHAPYCVGLTGTPISNRPAEMHPILEHLQPGKWGEFMSYARRYCDAKQVVTHYEWKTTGELTRNTAGKLVPKKERVEKKAWDFSGASRSPELYHRLRGSCMIRRLKDDVLDLLPAIQETIPIEPSARYKDAENGLLPDILLVERAEKDAIKLAVDPTWERRGGVALTELFAAAAMDKIDWAKEWLRAFLEDTDQKLVIFFHHQRIGEALASFLKEMNVGFVSLWGANPEVGGDLAFQEDTNLRIALCSYGAAREAVTLTAASYQLMLELTWVPGWMEQARDRTRRIGQENAVTYYYPVLVGSVEERLIDAVLSKQEIISVILDGKLMTRIHIDTASFDNSEYAQVPTAQCQIAVA